MSLESRIAALAAAIGADIKALVQGKQDALVSGTNIKTINGASALGSGNIKITGGGDKQIQFNDGGEVFGGDADFTWEKEEKTLTIGGTAARILGDFSNATQANRLMFQSSVTNGDTNLEVTPNGTANRSSLVTNNSSDPGNASVGYIQTTATEMKMESAKRGTASFLPIQFYTANTLKMSLAANANGEVTFFGTSPRIQGDFSSATVSSRLLFHSSVVNGPTTVEAIPNGTAKSSALVATNANTPDNSSSTYIQANATESVLSAHRRGAGSYLPLNIYTGGAERIRIDTSGNTTPGADNAQTLGASGKRWSVIYAGTGTINTSDAREKTPVRQMTQAEIDASRVLAGEIGVYKFLSAVSEKGDSARYHIGMTVQRAIEVMESHGLNPFEYGFICHDEWSSEQRNIHGEDGAVVDSVNIPAGDRYSFRPDELLLFVARGFDARLNALESVS